MSRSPTARPSSSGAGPGGGGGRGLTRVRLRKNLARAVRQGQPWIYRDALHAPASELPDGAPVLLTTSDERPLARGFWDAGAPIAVRLLESQAGRDDLAALVAERAGAALERRLGFIDRAQTDAFRWIHGEGDLLPGVHVDLYGAAATVRHDGAGARAFYAQLPERLVEAARARGVTVERVVERGGAPLLGPPPAPGEELTVRENGLLFGVDLLHGQKGGLFLDQRDNRARVRALAAGRRVLNLFGYTGGFSIYAAAGGAASTTTVDLAAPAIESARANFARNGFAVPRAGAHSFVAGDAFAFLEQAARAGKRWDLVISDPPSFAPSARALPRALGAYRRLHGLAAAVVAPGGVLCAASCSSHVGRDDFLRTVSDGAARAGRRFVLDEVHGAGADHPALPAFPEGNYLKFAVGQLG